MPFADGGVDGDGGKQFISLAHEDQASQCREVA
jgi:hypothetical protein